MLLFVPPTLPTHEYLVLSASALLQDRTNGAFTA